MHEKQRLMAMIRKYDFVLYELQLYLDTHPRCPEALRMWKNYQAMRQKAASAYIASTVRSSRSRQTAMRPGRGIRDRGRGKRRRTKCGSMKRNSSIR